MFKENGEETLVLFKGPDGIEYRISVDDESYARMLNTGYEAIEELMVHTRLSPDEYPHLLPEAAE